MNPKAAIEITLVAAVLACINGVETNYHLFCTKTGSVGRTVCAASPEMGFLISLIGAILSIVAFYAVALALLVILWFSFRIILKLCLPATQRCSFQRI